MAPDQHWCLACGTAVPGELDERPGWRAARTVIALTLVLVLGAVAASYAALKSGGSSPAPPPAPVASVPSTAPPAPTTSTPAPTTSTPTTPPAATTTSPSTLPKVTTPNTGTTRSAPVHPVTPATSTPTTSTPTTITPTTSTPTTSTPTTPATSTPSTTRPVEPAAKPIVLADGAGSAYDPYKQIVDQNDASRALDGKAGTSWAVLPKTPATPNVGYVVNVGKLQGIREIDLQTSTPGFRIEVYATDVATPPTDVTDARWSHITTRENVAGRSGADGKERIVLGAGSTKYRNVLLWITKGPASGDRIKIVDLKLLG